MNRFVFVLAFGFAILCAAMARAADPPPAGRIKHVVGTVAVVRGAITQPVQVGMLMLPGDRIVTGPRSRAGITLADDTLLAIGPDTVLSIDEFSFDATRQEGGLVATLVRGTLKVVSGLLAKRAPESVRFKTPTMVLGVRGTEFIIDTQGAGQ
ncbi:MAG: FecR domain-containing protein [Burkholderiaceae bacterium]|nr:FecR domain-containing protein [Burkholderiaceae bacterium]